MKNLFFPTVIGFVIGLILVGCQPSVRFYAKNSVPPSAKPQYTRHESKPRSTEKSTSFTQLELQKRRNQVASPDKSFGDAVVIEAEKWLGTPYCLGGADKNCTDCSGFVRNVYLSVGLDIPRTAADQYENTISIGREDLKKGDLVFFRDKDRISHVGIYAGNGEFIHASSAKGVIRTPLNMDYYKTKFAGARRVSAFFVSRN